MKQYFFFIFHFVDNIWLNVLLIDNFPDEAFWHATEPPVCLSQFSAHSQLFPTIFYTLTLCYNSKLTFCPKHFKTSKDKSEPNKDLTPGTKHFYNIWPNVEHLKHLSPKINLSWNLDFGDKISSELDSGKYSDCIIF